MGAYLSQPNVEKVSDDGCCGGVDGGVRYGASSMQGWRVSQEDSHNCLPDFDTDTHTSLFAVYDGHGGAEVAQYTALHLPKYVKDTDMYKEGKLQQALEDSFLGFDAVLTKDDVIANLKEIAGVNSDDELEENSGGVEGEKHKSEIADLREEADMPLEALLERYGGGAHAKGVKALKQQGQKFQSPMIRAKKADGATNEVNGDDSEAEPVKMNLDSQLANGHKEEDDEASTTEGKEQIGDGDANSKNEAKKSSADSTVITNNNTKEVSNSTSSSSEAGNSADVSSASGSNNVDVSSAGGSKDNSAEAEAGGSSSGAGGSGPSAGGSGSSAGGSGSSAVSSTSSSSGSSSQEAGGSSGSSSGATAGGSRSVAPDTSGNIEDSDEDEDEAEWEDDSEELDSDEELDEEDIVESDEEDGEEEEEEEEEMIMTGGEEPGSDSGCTAVVALMRDRELYVANAGDSRCVVCRDGKAIDMSVDHKPEDDLERNRIKKAGGRVTPDGRVNGGLNLSRAIGDHCYKQNKELSDKEQMITALPDVRSLNLDEKDTFMVLACDGIWNVMTSQDVVNFVKERLETGTTKLSLICEELFDFCLAPDTSGDGTGCDNMTCVIVTFDHLQGKHTVSNKRRASGEAETENTETKKPKPDNEVSPSNDTKPDGDSSNKTEDNVSSSNSVDSETT